MQITKNHLEAQKIQRKTKRMIQKKVISQAKKRYENETKSPFINVKNFSLKK